MHGTGEVARSAPTWTASVNEKTNAIEVRNTTGHIYVITFNPPTAGNLNEAAKHLNEAAKNLMEQLKNPEAVREMQLAAGDRLPDVTAEYFFTPRFDSNTNQIQFWRKKIDEPESEWEPSPTVTATNALATQTLQIARREGGEGGIEEEEEEEEGAVEGFAEEEVAAEHVPPPQSGVMEHLKNAHDEMELVKGDLKEESDEEVTLSQQQNATIGDYLGNARGFLNNIDASRLTGQDLQSYQYTDSRLQGLENKLMHAKIN